MLGWKKGRSKPTPVRQKTTVIRNRFAEAVQRIKHLEYYEAAATKEAPLGHFDGRPIIGSKTAINGGVFVGAKSHEAIVVDESYGELEKIYNSLTVEFVRSENGRDSFSEKIFPYVVRVVQRTLDYRPEAVRELERTGQIQPDRKVALDFFIRKGFGSSRHQVLLAAYLLEKLVRRGLLQGNYSLDEKMLSEHESSEKLEFISQGGTRFLFNPLDIRTRDSRHIAEEFKPVTSSLPFGPKRFD